MNPYLALYLIGAAFTFGIVIGNDIDSDIRWGSVPDVLAVISVTLLWPFTWLLSFIYRMES